MNLHTRLEKLKETFKLFRVLSPHDPSSTFLVEEEFISENLDEFRDIFLCLHRLWMKELSHMENVWVRNMMSRYNSVDMMGFRYANHMLPNLSSGRQIMENFTE